MWVRKTPEEISEEEKVGRYGLKTPIPFATVMGLLGFLTSLGKNPPVKAAAFGLLIFLAILGLCRLAFGSRRRALPMDMDPGPMKDYISGNFKICASCFDIKNSDQEPKCSCGGDFEPFENWKWVE